MKISELIIELNKIKDNNGIEDVFESCVSSLKVLNSKKEDKKVLKLFWQS